MRLFSRDVQPEAAEVLGELADGPPTGGVLAEGQTHQGRALGVELDGADLAALLVPGSDVAVAQGRFADGAAATGFLAHAFDGLIGQVAGVELGDRAHDAVQEHAAGGLIDVLGCGDQAHTGLVKGLVDLDVVSAVSRQAVQLVDDTEVDLGRLAQIAEHLLQLGPVGGASRLAAVHLRLLASRWAGMEKPSSAPPRSAWPRVDTRM